MKKLAVICLLIAIVVPHIFAQDNALYDVNYDKLEKIPHYDDSLDVFQKIYLQYEDAIKTTGNIIRQEEKTAYLKELEDFKAAERLRTDETIEKMRQAIYANEVESVREQETELLTAELTEKISAELNEKLSSEYEKIKNDEIAKLYANLKKEAYEETDATTQRVKSVSSASAKVLIVLLILALIFIGIKAIINKLQKKAEEKNKFTTFVTLYSYQLRDYNGNSHPITEKIQQECRKNEKEKNLRMKALSEAENRYSGDLKELQEYKDIFEGYTTSFRNYIRVWKEDNFQGISDYLKAVYGNYKKTGQELYKSFEFRTDADKKNAKDLLDIISKELEDFSEDIENKDFDSKFAAEKKRLAKNFADLAKSFKTGEF